MLYVLIAGVVWNLLLTERSMGYTVANFLLHGEPGRTPLRYELLLPSGSAGKLDVNGGHGVRVAPDLPSTLRSLPGVDRVRLSLQRPWLN